MGGGRFGGRSSLAAVPVQVGETLTLEDVVAVARGQAVELPSSAVERLRAARAVVEEKVASNETIYGVTTGFGSLANVRIDPAQADDLQHSIVRSHATAVGHPLSREEARAMLLLRAHVLALGYSGVRHEVVERMIQMLNLDLIPAVPEQGSLGASGDLAPLANLALPLLGEGEVLGSDGVAVPAAAALAAAGLEPLGLLAKEGLALVNGTQGMLAVGILAAERVTRLARAVDALAAATVPLASISERRLYRLLDPARNNGLPAFLVPDSGLNSGYMLVQYTAASLVSECKTLAHPASVDSIGSSAGQEDHVSMGMTAARHAREIVANAEVVVALEAMVAAQALDLRAPLLPGAATGAARAAVRAVVPFLDRDRELGPDMRAVVELVRDGGLVAAAEREAGPLD